MGRYLGAVFLAVLVGCAQAPKPPSEPLIPKANWVEVQPLPEDPTTKPLPEQLPPGDWVEPLEEGAPAPKAGLLISEERAWRDAQYRIRYPELRKNYIADRGVMGAHRLLYEERYATQKEKIRELQPGWWDQNKVWVGVLGGTVLGCVVTVAVLAVTQEVRQDTN